MGKISNWWQFPVDNEKLNVLQVESYVAGEVHMFWHKRNSSPGPIATKKELGKLIRLLTSKSDLKSSIFRMIFKSVND